MKFIELREGFSVKISEIVSVQRLEEDPEGMMSFVFVEGMGPQGSTFPYLALLQLLESQEEEGEVLRQMNNTIQENAQRFEG